MHTPCLLTGLRWLCGHGVQLTNHSLGVPSQLITASVFPLMKWTPWRGKYVDSSTFLPVHCLNETYPTTSLKPRRDITDTMENKAKARTTGPRVCTMKIPNSTDNLSTVSVLL